MCDGMQTDCLLSALIDYPILVGGMPKVATA
jgi:hypothetical protein